MRDMELKRQRDREAYHRLTPDERRERNQKAYLRQDKEKRREREAAYRETHKQQIRARWLRWYYSHLEENRRKLSSYHSAYQMAKYYADEEYRRNLLDKQAIRRRFGSSEVPRELRELELMRRDMVSALRRKSGYYQERDESARVAGSPVRPDQEDRVGRHDTSQGQRDQ